MQLRISPTPDNTALIEINSALVVLAIILEELFCLFREDRKKSGWKADLLELRGAKDVRELKYDFAPQTLPSSWDAFCLLTALPYEFGFGVCVQINSPVQLVQLELNGNFAVEFIYCVCCIKIPNTFGN